MQLFSSLFQLLSEDTLLDRKTIEEFCALNFSEILSEWIKDVMDEEKRYRAFLKGIPEIDSTSTFFLRRGAFATLNLQCIVLQRNLQKALDESRSVHASDLLGQLVSLHSRFIGNGVAGRYVRDDYAKNSRLQVGRRLHSSSEVLRATLGQGYSDEEMESGAYTLGNASQEFFFGALREKDGNLTIQKDFDSVVDSSGVPDLERQKLILQGMGQQVVTMGRRPKALELKNCVALDFQLLDLFLSEDLDILDISGCPQITSSDVSKIAQKCPKLRWLGLDNCSGLKSLSRSLFDTRDLKSFFQGNRIIFPKLQILNMSYCDHLEKCALQAPALKLVRASGNPKLIGVHIETLLFSFCIVDCKDSPNAVLADRYHIEKIQTSDQHFYVMGLLPRISEVVAFTNREPTIEQRRELLKMSKQELRKADLRNFEASHWDIQRLLKFAPQITHLFVSSSQIDDSTLELMTRFKFLESLSLTKCSSITEAGLRNFKRLVSLESLSLAESGQITDAGLSELQHCESLRNLSLSFCKRITGKGLLNLGTKLAILKLAGCEIFDRDLENLTKMPLQLLDLSGCYHLSRDGIFSLRSLSGLTSLSLSGLNIGDEALELFNGTFSLVNLNLSHCGGITNAGVWKLQHQKTLVSLDISNCPHVTSEVLGKLQFLKRLNLSFCDLMTDEISNYLSGFKYLEELRLEGCHAITDRVIDSITQLPNLSLVDLRECSGISAKGFESLRSLKHLKVLGKAKNSSWF